MSVPWRVKPCAPATIRRSIDGTEQPFRLLDIEVEHADQNPPLWKDLTYASVIALLLWVMAASMLV